MRLLVTGVTGFIGSHLAQAAAQGGHTVVGTGLIAQPFEKRIAAAMTAQGVTVLGTSLADRGAMQRALEGATHVCHLAAAMREAGTDERFFDSVNVQGTQQLLEDAAAAGVQRFVFCGTTGIYGHRVPGIVSESSALNPGNVYEVSKVSAERVLCEVAPRLGLEYAILRPSDVYGSRDRRLLKLFAGVARGRFPLFGAGAGRRHMIYISDVVDAFLLACTDARAVAAECILAGPEVTTLRGLLDELCRLFGRKRFGPHLPMGPMMAVAAVVEDVCTKLGVNPPIYRRRMDFYLSDAHYDTGRAQRQIGWTPRVGLTEGLRKTIAGYRADGDLA